MNCNHAREQILLAEGRGKYPREVMGHLQSCDECQRYQATFLGIENQISEMGISKPLLTSAARLDQIEKRLDGKNIFASPLLKFRRFEKERGRQKLSVAVALVAFLFAVAGGLMFIPRPIDRESIAGLRVYKESSINRAKSPLKKWHAMVRLAGEARTDAISAAARNDSDRVKMLADYLEELLRKDVERLVSFVELRDEMLDFAKDLARSESEFQRLASHYSSSPEIADSLVRIAKASKDAESRLRLALQA